MDSCKIQDIIEFPESVLFAECKRRGIILSRNREKGEAACRILEQNLAKRTCFRGQLRDTVPSSITSTEIFDMLSKICTPVPTHQKEIHHECVEPAKPSSTSLQKPSKLSQETQTSHAQDKCSTFTQTSCLPPISTNSQQEQSKRPRAPDGTRYSFTSRHPRRPVIQVKINDRLTIDALIDTGSDISMIRSSESRLLELQLQPWAGEPMTIMGKDTSPTSYTSFSSSMGNITTCVQAVIMDDIPYPVILGNDWRAATNCDIFIGRDGNISLELHPDIIGERIIGTLFLVKDQSSNPAVGQYSRGTQYTANNRTPQGKKPRTRRKHARSPQQKLLAVRRPSLNVSLLAKQADRQHHEASLHASQQRTHQWRTQTPNHQRMFKHQDERSRRRPVFRRQPLLRQRSSCSCYIFQTTLPEHDVRIPERHYTSCKQSLPFMRTRIFFNSKYKSARRRLII